MQIHVTILWLVSSEVVMVVLNSTIFTLASTSRQTDSETAERGSDEMLLLRRVQWSQVTFDHYFAIISGLLVRSFASPVRVSLISGQTFNPIIRIGLSSVWFGSTPSISIGISIGIKSIEFRCWKRQSKFRCQRFSDDESKTSQLLNPGKKSGFETEHQSKFWIQI